MSTVGSAMPSRSSSSVGAMRRLRRSVFRPARMRLRSSVAALRVKVTPSTSSGRTKPLSTSQITRSTMVAVLPEPAPAITRVGAGPASIMRTCSGVGFLPSAPLSISAISRALR
ncbi:Uncharacterised protein [Mycobacterium tuberculosis]|nr:Uncharacterised protein [Mycobacterium tuberculosis]